jgi:hypothetical protein
VKLSTLIAGKSDQQQVVARLPDGNTLHMTRHYEAMHLWSIGVYRESRTYGDRDQCAEGSGLVTGFNYVDDITAQALLCDFFSDNPAYGNPKR